MKCRRIKKYHQNPGADILTASIAPIVPYAVVGVVLYFYGGKIAALLGSKIASSVGPKVDTEKFAQDAATVAKAASTPWTTTKEVVRYVTGTTGYKGPQTSPVAKKPTSTVKSKAGDVVSKATEVVTKAKITTGTKAAQMKTNVTAGLNTIRGASAVEIKGAFSELFGGIFSKPAPAVVQNLTPEQKVAAAAARIKKSKGM